MSEKLQAVRGMCDVLPHETYVWRKLERAFAECMLSYHYREIRMPLLESTALFKRSIGEITDIVEKEMYTFQDRNGDSLSLRPEGTAGCVRACIENGLLHNQQQKLWYIGPMFRHEKPQKGRYRQFTQLGVEVFGIEGVGIELELISACQRLWTLLGITEAVQLEINTLGTIEERHQYREKLIHYFKQHLDQLDEDSLRRLEKNPLRILDSKNPAMQSMIEQAPKLMDALTEESQQHFKQLCQGLEALNISYTINPRLVRGLDYYEHTVFEWTTPHLGSQATVCAGGRFDKLVEQLGGKQTSAVGFAMGAERLLLLLQSFTDPQSFKDVTPLLFIMADSQLHLIHALQLAEKIRQHAPHWIIEVNTLVGSFKSQFKKADKSGARFALVLGGDEIQQQQVIVKDLRQNKEQCCIAQSDIYPVICSYIGE